MGNLEINLAELERIVRDMLSRIDEWEEVLSGEKQKIDGSDGYWQDNTGETYRSRMYGDSNGSDRQMKELRRIRTSATRALGVLAREHQRLQAASKVISGRIGMPNPSASVSQGSSNLRINYSEMDGLISELDALLNGDAAMDTGGQYGAWERCVRNGKSLYYASVGPEDYNGEISCAMENVNDQMHNFRDLLVIARENIESAEAELDNALSSFEAFKKANYKGIGNSNGLVNVTDLPACQLKAANGKSPQYCQDAGDPVNMATGNFHTQKEDMNAGGKPELRLLRTYNALGTGNGWNFHFDTKLCYRSGNVQVIRLPEGKEETWITGENGTPECVSGGKGILVSVRSGKNDKERSEEARAKLEKLREEEAAGDIKYNSDPEIEYEYRLPGEETYGYDHAGLCRYLEADGKKIRFTYDDEDRLIRAENNRGFISFTYEENTEMSVPGCMMPAYAEDHTGRKVLYSYETGADGIRRLSCVTGVDGAREQYGYGDNGKLNTLTDAKNVRILENEYDEKGRTVKQFYPDGSSSETVYDDENRVVIQREKDGSEIRYKRDERYRTTEILYPDGTKESYRYNAKNLRISGTDRLGRETRYAYDAAGRVTMVRDALGTATYITYNAQGKILTVKKAGVTVLRNVYDSHGDLLSTADASGSMTQFQNENGLPVSITDADGGKTEIRYDDKERVIEIQSRADGSICFAYDSLDRITGVSDGIGRTSEYRYDAAGRLVKLTRPDGASGGWTYDACGRITGFTDYDGNSTKRKYTVMGKPAEDVDKAGRTTAYAYDVMWNLSGITYPDGGKEERIHDSEGRLIKRILPDGGTTEFAYDACGNITSVTDGTGNTTVYEYDALNRAVKVIFADGSTVCRKFDEFGNVSEETDTAGGITVHTYDAAGRRISTVNPMGGRTEWSYTPAGKPEKTVYPGGLTEELFYESGRLIRRKKPDGTAEEYRYDETGRLTEQKQENGYTVTYRYDVLDRLTEIRDSEGREQYYDYDVLGQVREVRDALGNVTKYEFDVNGNLIKVTDACGHETEYGYNALDQLIEIRKLMEDGSASVISYTRNHAGQLLTSTDAEGHKEQYAYDAEGRLVRKNDADGFETLYSYNALGLTERVRFGDGTENTYRYDALRRLAEFTDVTGITRLENDALGRVLQVVSLDGRNTSYEWGEAGERRALVYPDGRRAEYRYDTLYRLTGLEEVLPDGTRRQTASYEYDIFGRLTEKKTENGVRTRFGYRPDGLMEELTSMDGNGKLLDSFRYVYDAAGNKVGEERNRGTEESFRYIYDPIGRLTQVERNNELLRSYGFDALGNRISMEDRKDGIHTGYLYSKGGQLLKELRETAEADAAGKTELVYAYDSRGNLTEIRENGQLKRSFLYGASGRIARAQRYGSSGSPASGNSAPIPSVSEYIYNGLGMRTARRNFAGAEQTEEISYLLDMTRPYHNVLSIRERSGRETLYLNDGLASEAISRETGRREYYISDEYGSPVRYTDENGNTTGLYGYDEYGTRTDLLSGISENLRGYTSVNTYAEAYADGICRPFTFTGYMEDEVSGLYFAQAREYDPASGRFAGKDWVKGFADQPYTLNEYGYCWNSPLMFVDLNGENPIGSDFPWKQVLIIGGAVIAATAVTVCTWGVGGVAGAAIIAGAVGASANVIGTATTDIINGKDSNWQTYVGSATGGAIGGVTAVISHGGVSPAGIGAITEGSSTLITEVLENVTGAKNRNAIEIAGDTLLNTVIGGATGYVAGKIPIEVPGVTAGRNSWDAVFKSGTTKLVNETAKRMGVKVALKGLGAALVSGGYDTGVDIVREFGEQWYEKAMSPAFALPEKE